VIKAAQMMAAPGVAVDVLSVTIWSELAREGQACAVAGDPVPFIVQQLRHSTGPIIAATDYVRAVPESIRAYLPQRRSYLTLGTDGFGRSDTRAALRGFLGWKRRALCALPPRTRPIPTGQLRLRLCALILVRETQWRPIMSNRTWSIGGVAIIEIVAPLLPSRLLGECRVSSEHFVQSHVWSRP
jgi:hypothetical protein